MGPLRTPVCLNTGPIRPEIRPQERVVAHPEWWVHQAR